MAAQVAMEVDPVPVYNATTQDAQIDRIFALSTAINHSAGFDFPDNGINLDQSNTASGYLSTIFSYMRKRFNSVSKENVGLEALDAKYGNYRVPHDNVQVTVVEWARTYRQGNPAPLEFDYMIATPIVNMLTAFKLVFNEGRLGTTKIASGSEGKTRNVPISDFGLT